MRTHDLGWIYTSSPIWQCPRHMLVPEGSWGACRAWRIHELHLCIQGLVHQHSLFGAPPSKQSHGPSSNHARPPPWGLEACISMAAPFQAQGGLQLDGLSCTLLRVRRVSKQVCTWTCHKNKSLQALFLSGWVHFLWRRDTLEPGLQPWQAQWASPLQQPCEQQSQKYLHHSSHQGEHICVNTMVTTILSQILWWKHTTTCHGN